MKEPSAQRIVFTAPRFHTNQYYAVKALLEAGHQVQFFALFQGSSEDYRVLQPQILGPSWFFKAVDRYFHIKQKSYHAYLRYYLPPVGRLGRLFRQFRPTITIIRDPITTMYGRLSIIMAKLNRSRLIFYAQFPRYSVLSPRVERLTRWCQAQWMTPVLGEPEPNRPSSDLIHYVPFVVPPVTPPELKLWFRNDKINIVMVGKFERRKNHLLLLQAIERLRDTYPLHLTLIGDCTEAHRRAVLEQVQQFISEHGMQSLVDIRLNIPFAEMLQEYAHHDLFVLPSRDEPAAVSPVEAMANSLPVICSDTCGTRCYIEPGQNGYIFRTDDVDDLAVKIEAIIVDRDRMVAMGERSYQLVVERHHPERYVESILTIAQIKS